MSKVLFGFIITFLLLSCSSDDTTQTEETNVLDGIWYFQRYETGTCTEEDSSGCGNAYEFQFLTDNTIEFTEENAQTYSQYSFDGDILNLEIIYMTNVRIYQHIGIYSYSETDDSFSGTLEIIAYDGFTTDAEVNYTYEEETIIFR
ncbi:hypothetical protein KO500_11865 [Cellulophaga baltica]|uniref:hypothetical protein n=1 Tax=Cellulophaga TaxID=104264 RepID=UPI001C0761A7|nr:MULTISPECIES: hypothetical protein [Cellulophaga]MBU2997136.1 hypothetical protein [Cellulophaga baltica]MDO6768534.1 hypothetical protein [Cellulophaga sp. 1_MG-2023]